MAETDQATVIQTISAALRDAPAIRALFLSGSHATGTADAYSDVDFVLVTPHGPTDEIAALWRRAVAQTGEIVLWWDRTTRPALINAITEDWTRTDAVILKPDQIGQHSRDRLVPLFDHEGLFDTLPETAAPQTMSPARLTWGIEEFIRILGLLHLAVGRQEYHTGVLGIFHLRNLLIELLIEETAAPHRGGALHLNRLLTGRQKALLDDLPPALPERDAMIAAYLAYAQAYLPRARRLAETRGLMWPARFEAATWAHLRDTLAIDRP